MEDEKSFLGTGWSFPPAFNWQSGSVDLVQAEEDIDQSLGILLSTSLGERVFQPAYGADLQSYVFDALNITRVGMLRDLIETAIIYNEPRIIVDQVDISPKNLIEGILEIEISYVIEKTNNRRNFVYDFYLREADLSIT